MKKAAFVVGVLITLGICGSIAEAGGSQGWITGNCPSPCTGRGGVQAAGSGSSSTACNSDCSSGGSAPIGGE